MAIGGSSHANLTSDQWRSLISQNQKRLGVGAYSPSGSSGYSAASVAANSQKDIFQQLREITNANNAWSADQAQKQMNFQRESNATAMQFEADEAEKSRLWQERMSNTAHQREIQDLQAAGLNPVLSAMGGSGAPVTSGATASGYSSQGAKGDTDTSLVPALVGLLSASMQTQASIANTTTSALTQSQIADRQIDASKWESLLAAHSAENVANINKSASLGSASIHAQGTITASSISAAATQAAAQIGANASIINSAINYASHIEGIKLETSSAQSIAQFNAAVNMYMQERGYDYQFDLQQDQQSHDFKLHITDDVINGLFGLGKAALYSKSSSRSSNLSGILALLKYLA